MNEIKVDLNDKEVNGTAQQGKYAHIWETGGYDCFFYECTAWVPVVA